MSENIRKDPIALRRSILDVFIRRLPIWNSYNHFCKRMGKEKMDYNEFEFWFMRFANGNFDLNYDRSLDPKTPSLSDMPDEIHEKIINKLPNMDRLIIRKVSKHFRYLTDRCDSRFKYICIQFQGNFVNIFFSSGYECVYYTDDYYNILHESEEEDDSEDLDGKIVIAENYQKLAIDDLAIVLKNPKLKLDELVVDYGWIEKKEAVLFESMLKSLNGKIHVTKCEETFGSNLTLSVFSEITILPYLKTGTLKEIDLRLLATDRKEGAKELKTQINRITKLEQCKNAEMLKVISDFTTDSFPIKSFLECRRLTIKFKEAYIVERKMANLTRKLLKSNVLEVAILKTSWILSSEFFRQFGERAIEVPGCPNARHIPITGSDEFFKIEVNGYSIHIERTSN